MYLLGSTIQESIGITLAKWLEWIILKISEVITRLKKCMCKFGKYKVTLEIYCQVSNLKIEAIFVKLF